MQISESFMLASMFLTQYQKEITLHHTHTSGSEHLFRQSFWPWTDLIFELYEVRGVDRPQGAPDVRHVDPRLRFEVIYRLLNLVYVSEHIYTDEAELL